MKIYKIDGAVIDRPPRRDVYIEPKIVERQYTLAKVVDGNVLVSDEPNRWVKAKEIYKDYMIYTVEKYKEMIGE